MTAVATASERRTASPPAARRRRQGPLAWLREHIIAVVAAFAFLYLLLPNAVVVLFSFNQPAGRFNLTWQRFSLDAWLNPCGPPGMCPALGLSLGIGVAATVIATLLGTPRCSRCSST
jgi:spermidine/putrescine transport system permease protein